MSVLYTNNAKTTLSASLNNSATSLSVASSSGFPSLSGSHYFYATLDDNTNLEVVKVTAVSGTTWTVVRGQDNTSATAFSSGDTVELRLNAALLTDVVNDALASSFTRQDFTGNGSTTAFTLNKTPGSENDLIVFIEGVFQNQADYTLSGTTLTFDEAPASSRKIVVYHVSASVSGDSLALNTFSGDGSTTAFTMSVDPLYENNTMVFIDGVYQNKSTYSTSGTTLTFDAAPANGTAIDVTTHTQATVNVPVDGSVSTAKLAADAVTGAKIADDAIDSEHYTDGSIDTAHIGNLQVTTAKLAADAVTAAKLADDAVVTANITDDAVTTAKVADDQITLAKLAGLARGKIIYGDASGNPAALALGSAGTVLTSDGTDISWAEEVAVNYLPLAGGTMTGNIAHASDFTIDVGGDIVLDAAGGDVSLKNAGNEAGKIVIGDVTDPRITLDVTGDIYLDADGGDIIFADGGTQIADFENSSSDFKISSLVSNKDLILGGNDNGTFINALTLDMSNAGRAIFNAGGTFNDHVYFGDDNKLVLGGGDDLTIYHTATGNHSIIEEIGGGNLVVRTNGAHIEFDKGSTEYMARMIPDGAVELYYDSAKKLETTSTGVEVNGGIRLSGLNGGDGLKFDMAGSADYVIKESSTNDVFSFGGLIHHNISSGRVGIGTTSPDGPLHVKPASGDTYVILEAGQADGNAGLLYHNNSGTQVGYNLYDTDDNIYYIGVGGINRFTVRSGSHFELRGPDANSNQVKMMDSSGNIDGYLYAEASEIGFLDADGNWAMQVKTDNYVRFLVNNSEGGRFDSSGNLLIGTTSSAQASGTGIKLTGDDRLYMVNALTSGEQISYYGNGGYKFFVGVNGTIYSTNTSISAISDGRLKENVRDLDTGLEQVLALQPRRFDWKEGEGTGHKDVIGFVAQEVESVLPDVINDFKHDVYDDAKSIKTSDIVPTLVKAIQEQQTIIDDLKARIEKLES